MESACLHPVLSGSLSEQPPLLLALDLPHLLPQGPLLEQLHPHTPSHLPGVCPSSAVPVRPHTAPVPAAGEPLGHVRTGSQACPSVLSCPPLSSPSLLFPWPPRAVLKGTWLTTSLPARHRRRLQPAPVSPICEEMCCSSTFLELGCPCPPLLRVPTSPSLPSLPLCPAATSASTRSPAHCPPPSPLCCSSPTCE